MVFISKLRPGSLQQKIVLFVLLPVFFLLAGMGGVGFFYSRDAILDQWGETAVSKLQEAAHLIDMRLKQPKELLLMLKDNSGSGQNHEIHQFIIERLRTLDGVVQVKVDWPETIGERLNLKWNPKVWRMPMMQFNSLAALEVSLPQYNANLASETISVSTEFKDKNDKTVGRVEVVIAFNDLIEQIIEEEWWKTNKAFLIDNSGNILLSTVHSLSDPLHQNLPKFAQTNLLEKKTLEALKKKSSGTLFGPGHPPDEISGYYHLKEAPWSLVIIAPGKKILDSVRTFSLSYFGGSVLFILIVILFIRATISRTTRAIKNVSDAARNLALGNFGDPLPVQSRDEVGELTQNFNTMTRQLKERNRLKADMNLAMEVQQNLLPKSDVSTGNIDISGSTVYCDETGGDFFDIIPFSRESGKIGLVVGDVVGHGIAAALLMATTRGFIRSRVQQGGPLSRMITDVNQLLCQDTSLTHNFVSLFFMAVDTEKNQIQWVRAGHDPAIVYHPQKDDFSELNGNGLVLGVDETLQYSEHLLSGCEKKSIILIGSDGAWETQNSQGERFGKTRVKNALKKAAHLSSKDMIQAILSEIETFKGETRQEDDITLMILKFL